VAVTYEHPVTVVVRLNGELDLADEPQLQAALDSIAEPAGLDLRVDLSAVRFASVGILVRIAYAAGHFRSARIDSLPPPIEKVLRILDLIDARGDFRSEVGPPPPVWSGPSPGCRSRTRLPLTP
jgi:anti-anti-sigma regulatory factor